MASGEIPARAVRTGLIDRFGSIDPNEGGITQRENLNLEYRWKINDTQRLDAQAYLTYYQLSLFNDFSFFLNDPVNGDMINQRDTRFMGGFNTQYEIDSTPFGIPLTSTRAAFSTGSTRRTWCWPTPCSGFSWPAPRTSTSSSSRSRRS